MFRKKTRHCFFQPTGRHIPDMLEQKRKQCDKRKIKRPAPQKDSPTTLALLAYLYINLNYLGRAIYSQHAVTLRSGMRPDASPALEYRHPRDGFQKRKI